MPHVDEGTLHALLDGALRAEDPDRAAAVDAHLEGCADCRALLEQAVALRHRSADVLGLLEPTVVPDFEEVLVRAGASAGERRRLATQARWTRGLAWAATLVIALGTGYLIRDRLAPDRAAVTRDARDAAATSAAPAAGPEPELMELEPAPSSDALRAADPPPRRAPEAPGAGPAPSGDREEQVPRGSTPTEAAGAERTDAPRADQELPNTLTPTRDAVEPSRGVELQGIIVTGAAAPGVVEPGPRAVSPAVASALLGTPLLVLPDAELGEIVADEDAEGPVVASIQRLADGVEIRVTQRPGDGAADEAESRVARQRAPSEPLGVPVDRREPPARFLEAPPAGVREALSRAGDRATGDAAKSSAMERAAQVNTIHVRLPTADLLLEGPLPEGVLRLLAAGATPLPPGP